MKKILLILACVLGITCCSHREIAYPTTQNGTFRPNTSRIQAQNILYEACTKAGWQVLSKGNSQYKINYNHHGYEFTALIKYTTTNYSILFNRVNHDKGNIHVAYAVYEDNAAKLNRVIQKYSAKTR